MTKVQIANEYNVELLTVNAIRAWMTVNQADYTSCTELAEVANDEIYHAGFTDKDGNEIDEEVFFELAAQFDF